MTISVSFFRESTIQKQSVSVAPVLLRDAYALKSKRSFFNLERVMTASPTLLKQSEGRDPLNSSLREERLPILERLLQIMAILVGLVPMLGDSRLQDDHDLGVLRGEDRSGVDELLHHAVVEFF